MNLKLHAIDDFVVHQNQFLVSLIICAVMISTGTLMLVEHTGMTAEQIQTISIVGFLFLAGGISVTILNIILYQMQRTKSEFRQT